ncbi:MAG: HD domain-containing protein [Erysipelotrichales bacterium]|nr:HD domain-containing protein [Erysipelotrichales bacterium]
MRKSTSNKLLTDAIITAAKYYEGTDVPGTDRPYIFHCMDVARELDSLGVSYEAIAASLLMETFDLSNAAEEEYRAGFGETVLSYITELASDPAQTPSQRRNSTLKRLPQLSDEAKIIFLADVCISLEELAEDWAINGNDAFKHRHTTRKALARYYSAALDELVAFAFSEDIAGLYQDAMRAFSEIFCRFYYDPEEDVLYLETEEGEYLKRTPENDGLEAVSVLPDEAEEISAEDFYFIQHLQLNNPEDEPFEYEPKEKPLPKA